MNKSRNKRNSAVISYKELNSTLENDFEDTLSDSDTEIVFSPRKNKVNGSESASTSPENTPRKKLGLKLQMLNIDNGSTKNCELGESGLRRGSRIRRKPKTLIEELNMENSNAKKAIDFNADDDSPGSTFLESDETDAPGDNIMKTSTLFTEDDIHGQEIFNFKVNKTKSNLLKKATMNASASSPALKLNATRTPKKKQSIHDSDEDMLTEEENEEENSSKSNKQKKKQSVACVTPKRTKPTTQQTPRSKKIERPPKTPQSQRSACNTPLRKITLSIENTPAHVRRKIRDQIIKELESESDGDDGDYSASSSDYVPSGEESPTQSSESEEGPEKNDDDDEISFTTPPKPFPVKGSRKAKTHDNDFVVEAESYFLMQSSKKNQTSNRTLGKIKKLNLNDENRYLELNEMNHISVHHKECLSDLNDQYRSYFDQWEFLLAEGYSILVYGVGSKRKILEDFRKNSLIVDQLYIVINGFFPNLTIKSIAEAIMIDILKMDNTPSNLSEAAKAIGQKLLDINLDLFCIVHSIDGPMLRNNKSQNFLSQLAQQTNVHLITSIDHINGPLLWDKTKLTNFKFKWFDVTTFMPYDAEGCYENSITMQKSGALALSSLKSVYQSLTKTAKAIFVIIAKKILENEKTPHYQGLPFKDLYSLAAESFLVRSAPALRAQLREFLDHKLIKLKRSADGSENLTVCIDNSLLQQFLEEQEE